MGRVSKTFWILDLGSWVVRLLKVQSLYGQLIDWESFDYIHQASVKNTLNFQQNYLKQLPGALDKILERSSISGPIHVLLPSSMFNYEFDLKHKNKLKVNLNENIRHEVNSLLAKKIWRQLSSDPEFALKSNISVTKHLIIMINIALFQSITLQAITQK